MIAADILKAFSKYPNLVVCPEYPFAVSADGTLVLSLVDGKIKPPNKTYFYDNVIENGQPVYCYNVTHSRLVAITFNIPNPDNKKRLSYKDGNSKNNSVDNLFWGGHVSGPKKGSPRPPDKIVKGPDGTIYKSMRYAAKMNGLNPETIKRYCINNKKGWSFET